LLFSYTDVIVAATSNQRPTEVTRGKLVPPHFRFTGGFKALGSWNSGTLAVSDSY